MWNSIGKIQTEISKRIEKSLKVYYNLTKQLIWNGDVPTKKTMAKYTTYFKPVLTNTVHLRLGHMQRRN